jgi:hypothetical protein
MLHERKKHICEEKTGEEGISLLTILEAAAAHLPDAKARLPGS